MHGATVPLWQFDLLAPQLHALRFRTLRFDLLGHGQSDRPAIDYSIEVFVRQTIELMEATGFARPTAILGHSLGAAIAVRVAAARPEWIERLVLVAPMLDFNSTSRWTPIFRCPGVGRVFMQFFGIPALVRRRRARYSRIGQPHLAARFAEQVSYDGFARALLSMVRCGTLGNQAACYAALAELGRDVLVISGSDDAVIPEQHVARICRLLNPHGHVALVGAEHNLLLTHAAEAAALVHSFANEDHKIHNVNMTS